MNKPAKAVRIETKPNIGLTDKQVKERMEQGLFNGKNTLKTKSFGRIIRDNVCTLFNFVNAILAAAIFYVGSYENALFMIVVLFNLVIGTIQEIRAKVTIDKLSIVSMIKAKIIRNGQKHELSVDQIVLDDIIELTQGDQVPTDSILLEGSCEVNESLLTGESDAIYKNAGGELMSGSFLVSGTCRVRANKVGKDNYAAEISSGAKYIKKVNSEIMKNLNRIIRIISICIFPLGALMFFRQLNVESGVFEEAVVNTVASLIGMIPEGLILLTSTVLAVSVVRLSKHKVLVQELYCIETLARVDVLCLDKTGTITEGCMEVKEVFTYADVSKAELEEALNAYAQVSKDENPTMCAIKEKYKKKTTFVAKEIMAFSSDKKWSGVTFKDKGTYVLGAEEFVLGEASTIKNEMNLKIEDGFRVLVVAHAAGGFNNRELPNDLKPMGIVVIKDKIRKEAKVTLDYFAQQGVELKIISGDNVRTVSAIAKEAGLKAWESYIDASTISTEEEIAHAAKTYSIFGRVTPKQKLQLVKALKANGHTVAMTGDGVNDVLALKEADCSVAMATGSDAARSVSQLVLLNSNFSSMPKVVAEGRRSINNIQRSASLFLVKTIYSFLLTIVFICIGAQYPFEPIQMTLISAFTIGAPSFVLALEPNKNRIQGNFFWNIMSKALPGGIAVTLTLTAIVILGAFFTISEGQASTLSVIATAYIGLMVLWKTSSPFSGMQLFKKDKYGKKKICFKLPSNLIRAGLFIVMTCSLFIGITCFTPFFKLVNINLYLLLLIAVTLAFATTVYIMLNIIMNKLLKNKSK